MKKTNKEKINVKIFRQINVKFFRLNKTENLEKYGIILAVLIRANIVILLTAIFIACVYQHVTINEVKKIDNCVNRKINEITDTVNEIKNKLDDPTFGDSIPQNILDNILDNINELKKEINSNFEIVHSKIDDLSFENQGNLDSLVNKGQLSEKINQLDRKVDEIKNQIIEKGESGYPIILSLLIFIGILLAIEVCFKNKTPTTIKIASGVALISLMFKIIPFEKLAFGLSLGNSYNTTYTSTTLSDPTTSTTLLDTTLIIGPFKSGYDSLEHEGLLKLENAKVLLSDTSKSFSEIMILGGVDKRPLRRKALLKFGDNLSLAQARANFIQQYLVEEVFSKKPNQPLPKFIVLVNGANVYDDKDSAQFADSRCVKIVGKYPK